MKKIFFLFLFVYIFTVSNVCAISYKDYKVGDVIEYRGDSYYVILNSDKDEQIVSTIKAEPLTVDEINSYREVGHINVNTNESIGTAYNMNGYGAIAYYSDNDRCGYHYINQDSGTLTSIHIPQYEHCVLKYKFSNPAEYSSDIK